MIGWFQVFRGLRICSMCCMWHKCNFMDALLSNSIQRPIFTSSFIIHSNNVPSSHILASLVLDQMAVVPHLFPTALQGSQGRKIQRIQMGRRYQLFRKKAKSVTTELSDLMWCFQECVNALLQLTLWAHSHTYRNKCSFLSVGPLL